MLFEGHHDLRVDEPLVCTIYTIELYVFTLSKHHYSTTPSIYLAKTLIKGGIIIRELFPIASAWGTSLLVGP